MAEAETRNARPSNTTIVIENAGPARTEASPCPAASRSWPGQHSPVRWPGLDVPTTRPLSPEAEREGSGSPGLHCDYLIGLLTDRTPERKRDTKKPASGRVFGAFSGFIAAPHRTAFNLAIIQQEAALSQNVGAGVRVAGPPAYMTACEDCPGCVGALRAPQTIQRRFNPSKAVHLCSGGF